MLFRSHGRNKPKVRDQTVSGTMFNTLISGFSESTYQLVTFSRVFPRFAQHQIFFFSVSWNLKNSHGAAILCIASDSGKVFSPVNFNLCHCLGPSRLMLATANSLILVPLPCCHHRLCVNIFAKTALLISKTHEQEWSLLSPRLSSTFATSDWHLPCQTTAKPIYSRRVDFELHTKISIRLGLLSVHFSNHLAILDTTKLHHCHKTLFGADLDLNLFIHACVSPMNSASKMLKIPCWYSCLFSLVHTGTCAHVLMFGLSG